MQKNIEIIKKKFESDNYAVSLGVVLDELTEDTVRMRMPLREDMLNWAGRPHGGAIYALADVAFSVLGNNTNNMSVALDCSITYHESPDPGTMLIVLGQTLSETRRTAAFLFKVYMEKEGDLTLVATMKSLVYRTGKPIESDAG
jgi:uncharacterized protein (TIGR00369 family)